MNKSRDSQEVKAKQELFCWSPQKCLMVFRCTIGSKYSYPPQFWLTQILSGNTEPHPPPSVSHLSFLSHPVVIYCIYLEAVFYEHCSLSINLIKLYLQGNYTFTLLMKIRRTGVPFLTTPPPLPLLSITPAHSPFMSPSLPLPPPPSLPLPYSLRVLFQYTDNSHSEQKFEY